MDREYDDPPRRRRALDEADERPLSRRRDPDDDGIQERPRSRRDDDYAPTTRRSEDDDLRPGRDRPRRDRYGEDDDYPPRRRKRPRQKSNLGLILGLCIGGGALLIGALVIIIVAATSGSADRYKKHEDLARELVLVMKDYAAALESVKDPQSARTAAIKIEKMCDQLEALEQKAKALPAITLDEDKRLERQLKPQFDELTTRITGVAFQAGLNSRGEHSFLVANQRVERIGKRMEKMGRRF